MSVIAHIALRYIQMSDGTVMAPTESDIGRTKSILNKLEIGIG